MRLRTIPIWAWAVSCLGGASLVAGGFVSPSSYARDVLSNIGAALLLVVPLVAAERAIVAAIESGARERVAADLAEASVRMGEFFADFGERLASPRPMPPASAEAVEAMLLHSGWSPLSEVRGFRVWQSDGRMVAVPLDGASQLSYTVQRHVRRAVGWTDDEFLALYQAVGEEPPAEWLTARDEARRKKSSST